MQPSWLSVLTADARPDELPLLAETPGALVALLEDDLAPLRRVASGVIRDPALALRVLQRANAVPHRYFRFEISSLEEAVHMLGTRTLARILEETRTAEVLVDAGRAGAYRSSAGRAVLSALFAQDWAEVDRDRFPAQVSLAALLNNLGELFLLAHGDDRMSRYLEIVERCHAYPHEAEYVTLGESLEDLGYRLALLWGLPEMVRESMRARNAQHARTLCVMLATQAARYAFSGWRHPMQGNDLRLVARLLDLDVSALRARINRVLVDFNAAVGLYGLDPLPLLPTEVGEDERAVLATSHFCLAPRADDYARARDALRARPTDSDAIFRALLRGLHRGLGLNRAVIALYDPKERRLRADYLVGTDFEPGFNRFVLPMAEGGLFARLLAAPDGLWVGRDGRSDPGAEIPQRIRELTGVDSFFAIGLRSRGQPLGVVYADRRSASCALDERSFEGFLALAELAQRCLEPGRS